MKYIFLPPVGYYYTFILIRCKVVSFAGLYRTSF
jgi:hypothetical protein